MEVNKPESPAPVGKDGGRGQQQAPAKQRRGNEPATPGSEPSPTPAGEGDAVSVGGLLANGVTPEVQKAFDRLARQIEPLRHEVELAKAREKHLRELADKHSFLPVGNRRAFERELTHVLNHLHHLSAPASVICLHVVGADAIRQHHGQAAREALLAHVHAVVRSFLHPTDAVGSLGGNDFGVILLVADLETARAKAAGLVEAIGGTSWQWEGNPVSIQSCAGVCGLSPGAAAPAILAAADRDLVRSRRALTQGSQA